MHIRNHSISEVAPHNKIFEHHKQASYKPMMLSGCHGAQGTRDHRGSPWGRQDRTRTHQLWPDVTFIHILINISLFDCLYYLNICICVQSSSSFNQVGLQSSPGVCNWQAAVQCQILSIAFSIPSEVETNFSQNTIHYNF